MANKPVVDQWLVNADGTPDPFAANIDFGMTAADERDPDLNLEDHPGLNPEIILPSTPEQAAPPEPVVPAAPVDPPEPEGPEVFDIGDGAFVTRTKERGQWKAVLDPGTGANPEVFWGKNKDELLTNVLKGKLEATRKIRELNKKAKLAAPSASRQVPQAPTPVVRDLTADESFEIKALLESNPSLAIDTLFQKKTGLNMQQLVDLAQKGAQANMSLETEGVAREFVQRNPEYYADSDNRNFNKLIEWLSKYKLNKIANETNSQELFSELWQTGNFTVQNLEEAFEDLTEDGKLIKPRLPKTPPPVEVPSVPPAPQPAPAAPNPRILSTETRPRAATGIRSSDVTPVAAPVQPAAPTDESFENMTDDEIKNSLAAVRRYKAQLARRS